MPATTTFSRGLCSECANLPKLLRKDYGYRKIGYRKIGLNLYTKGIKIEKQSLDFREKHKPDN